MLCWKVTGGDVTPTPPSPQPPLSRGVTELWSRSPLQSCNSEETGDLRVVWRVMTGEWVFQCEGESDVRVWGYQVSVSPPSHCSQLSSGLVPGCAGLHPSSPPPPLLSIRAPAWLTRILALRGCQGGSGQELIMQLSPAPLRYHSQLPQQQQQPGLHLTSRNEK